MSTQVAAWKSKSLLVIVLINFTKASTTNLSAAVKNTLLTMQVKEVKMVLAMMKMKILKAATTATKV